MISIVACCRGAKLCAHAARDFRSQQYAPTPAVLHANSCQNKPLKFVLQKWFCAMARSPDPRQPEKKQLLETGFCKAMYRYSKNKFPSAIICHITAAKPLMQQPQRLLFCVCAFFVSFLAQITIHYKNVFRTKIDVSKNEQFHNALRR